MWERIPIFPALGGSRITANSRPAWAIKFFKKVKAKILCQTVAHTCNPNTLVAKSGIRV